MHKIAMRQDSDFSVLLDPCKLSNVIIHNLVCMYTVSNVRLSYLKYYKVSDVKLKVRKLECSQNSTQIV